MSTFIDGGNNGSVVTFAAGSNSTLDGFTITNGSTSGNGGGILIGADSSPTIANCIITDNEGHNVFADWTCNGPNFLGCEGDFTLRAGTGKFQGITGSSPLQARTTFSEIAVHLESGAVIESSTGLLTLPKLTFKLP